MIRYSLGPQDVDALAGLPNPVRARTVRIYRRMYAAMMLALLVLGALTAIGGSSVMSVVCFAYAAFTGGLAVAADALVGRNLRKQYRALMNAGGFAYLLGDNAVEITPGGFQHIGPTGESLLYWSAIEEASLTGSYVVVRYSQIGVFLIPVSAFGSEAAAQTFVMELHRHRLSVAHQPVEAPVVAAPSVAPAPQAQAAPPASGGNWWRQGSQVVGDDQQTQRRG